MLASLLRIQAKSNAIPRQSVMIPGATNNHPPNTIKQASIPSRVGMRLLCQSEWMLVHKVRLSRRATQNPASAVMLQSTTKNAASRRNLITSITSNHGRIKSAAMPHFNLVTHSHRQCL